MAALRRRMQVLRKIWPNKPLPPPLVISFFLLHFLFSPSAAVGVAGLRVVG
jgi:hypothetical protein